MGVLVLLFFAKERGVPDLLSEEEFKFNNPLEMASMIYCCRG
jgi:hypothetical protein